MQVARIKVKVIGKGTDEEPYKVDLPTYAMVGGTEEYDTVDKKKLVAVVVEVPAEYLNSKGKLSAKKIQAMYKGQPRIDNPTFLKQLKSVQIEE